MRSDFTETGSLPGLFRFVLHELMKWLLSLKFEFDLLLRFVIYWFGHGREKIAVKRHCDFVVLVCWAAMTIDDVIYTRFMSCVVFVPVVVGCQMSWVVAGPSTPPPPSKRKCNLTKFLSCWSIKSWLWSIRLCHPLIAWRHSRIDDAF